MDPDYKTTGDYVFGSILKLVIIVILIALIVAMMT